MKFRWIFFSLVVFMMVPLQVGAQHGTPGDFGRHMDDGGFTDPEHEAFRMGGPVQARMRHYDRLYVPTWEDPFVHPGRFSEVTGGMPFVDENGDKIEDIVQNTPRFHSSGFGPFIDQNGDSIHDPFQTREMYMALGMKNFVDIDGDGICDNYVPGLGFMGYGFHLYENFDVDLDEDVFIHPGRFSEVTGGMAFVDENGDGIVDVVQNTPLFHSFDFGPFMDENNDTIHDPFQTWQMYHDLGMKNFVDADGDGLSDNYEWDAGLN